MENSVQNLMPVCCYTTAIMLANLYVVGEAPQKIWTEFQPLLNTMLAGKKTFPTVAAPLLSHSTSVITSISVW